MANSSGTEMSVRICDFSDGTTFSTSYAGVHLLYLCCTHEILSIEPSRFIDGMIEKSVVLTTNGLSQRTTPRNCPVRHAYELLTIRWAWDTQFESEHRLSSQNIFSFLHYNHADHACAICNGQREASIITLPRRSLHIIFTRYGTTGLARFRYSWQT